MSRFLRLRRAFCGAYRTMKDNPRVKAMIEIPLTKGFITVIDDEDAELVMRHKWHANQVRDKIYAYTNVRDGDSKKHVSLHRLLLGPAPGLLVDHADGDTLNNTRANLRLASYAENGANCGPRKHNRAGIKGVQFPREGRKWQARIKFGTTEVHLGSFATAEEAGAAYARAAREFYGEFARTEFPSSELPNLRQA